MRKSIMLIIILLLASGRAWAILDDNSTNLDQSQVTSNHNDNRDYNNNTDYNANNNYNSAKSNADSFSSSSSFSDNDTDVRNSVNNDVRNDNDLKNTQTAVGIVNQETKQGNDQETTTSVDASENNNTKVYANGWPGISGEQGTNNFNGYSIFGGIGVSSTAAYKVCIEKLANVKQMEDAGYLTHEEAVEEAKVIWLQLKRATHERKLFGILWREYDRTLLNGFGLLAW